MIRIIFLLGTGFLAALITSCDDQHKSDERKGQVSKDVVEERNVPSFEGRKPTQKRQGGEGIQKVEGVFELNRNGIADQLSADPSVIESMISDFPPGGRRARFIRDLLSVLGDDTLAVTTETATRLLKIIDQTSLPEDQGQLLGSRMNDIIARLTINESTALLAEVKEKPMRVAIAYGIGAKLAKDKNLNLSFTDKIPKFDRVNLLCSYGGRYDFSNIKEMVDFISSVKVDDTGKDIVVEAAIASTDNLPPEELIEESIRFKSRDEGAGVLMFKKGFGSMFDDDSIRGSKYLIDNKDKIPTPYYREAVAMIVKRLNELGDKAGAEQWARELE